MYRHTFLFRFAAICLLAMLCGGASQAQKKITIANFYLAENDLDAQQNYPKNDNNGDPCAIIKVQKNDKGFGFDVGTLGVVAVDANRTGETWVYVPQGIRHIKILHDTFGNSDEYDLPTNVEKGRVYIMEIVTEGAGMGKFIQEAEETGKYVEFFVTPANVSLQVGQDMVLLDQGHAEKFMGFGPFQWQATAPNYHNDAGTVTVDRKTDGNVRVRINLKPAFGFADLKAEGDMVGATVFIDGENVGQLPYKSKEMKSGKHKLRVAKKLYKTFEQDFVVEDAQTTTLTPVLQPNFAVTTLTVDADAEIWVNGQKKGVKKWSGPLEVGNYKVECRQERHATVSQNISITSNKDARTFTLNAPVPIYGGLRITSKPSQADVYVDGEKVGATPYYTTKLLIGNHNVELRREGYSTSSLVLNIKEGETIERNAELNNIAKLSVTTTPDNVNLRIDGKYVGHTPYSSEMAAGKHTLEMSKEGFYDKVVTISLDGSKSNYNFSLDKKTSTVTIRASKFFSLYVDGQYVSVKDDKVELPHGNHTFTAENYRHYKGEVTKYISGNTSSVYIMMTRDMIQPGAFYLDLMYKQGKCGGLGVNLGCYIHNVNIEGEFGMPFGVDDVVTTWRAQDAGSGNTQGVKLEFSPKMEYGGKVGYGIRMGKRVRVTPQVGARLYQIEAKSNDLSVNTYSLMGVGSLRLSLALCNGVAVTVAPEYAVSIVEGDTYKKVKDVSKDIKNWTNGFNIFAGLTLFL